MKYHLLGRTFRVLNVVLDGVTIDKRSIYYMSAHDHAWSGTRADDLTACGSRAPIDEAVPVNWSCTGRFWVYASELSDPLNNSSDTFTFFAFRLKCVKKN